MGVNVNMIDLRTLSIFMMLKELFYTQGLTSRTRANILASPTLQVLEIGPEFVGL